VAGLSLGTSGAIRMAVPDPGIDEQGTLFCYALTDSIWIVGGAVSNGGIVIRWAGDALAPDLPDAADGSTADEALLELAASVPAGSDGLVMLPYLLAERAPLWDPDVPGAYLGLRRDHGRGHLVRAAVEGVCMQLRVVLDQLDRLSPVRSVRVTGGAFRSSLWHEVMAATLDRPLYAVGDAEGTALGAAALGLFALGRAGDLADALVELAGPDTSPTTPPVVADPALVAVYERTHAAVPDLIEALSPVAALFARDESARATPPPRRDGRLFDSQSRDRS
jgi:gluconokinase